MKYHIWETWNLRFRVLCFCWRRACKVDLSVSVLPHSMWSLILQLIYLQISFIFTIEEYPIVHNLHVYYPLVTLSTFRLFQFPSCHKYCIKIMAEQIYMEEDDNSFQQVLMSGLVVSYGQWFWGFSTPFSIVEKLKIHISRNEILVL